MPTAARKTKPADEAGLDLIDLDATTAEEKSVFTEVQPLFRANRKTYSARTTFTAGEAIKYAKIWRNQGIDDAIEYAMTLAIGPDGWDVLQNHLYLSPDKLGEITMQVINRILPVVDPKSSSD
jgi:hypothetical protein